MSPAEQAVQFFISQGYSPVHAAALVGRLQQESGPGLDVNASGDHGTAYGIAQWREARQDGLRRFAAANGADPADFQTQLAYVHHELQGPESRAGQMLRSATTLEDAAAAAMAYERPQGFTWENPRAGHGWDNTLSYARALSGGTPSPIGQAMASVSPTQAQDFAEGKAPTPSSKDPAGLEIQNAAVMGSAQRGLGDVMAALAPSGGAPAAAPPPAAPALGGTPFQTGVDAQQKALQNRGLGGRVTMSPGAVSTSGRSLGDVLRAV